MANSSKNYMSMSPLTLEEIEMIEATKLPAIDRHYIRILAHCLECFKDMAQDSLSNSIPNEVVRSKWLLKQNNFNNHL